MGCGGFYWIIMEEMLFVVVDFVMMFVGGEGVDKNKNVIYLIG